LEPFYNRPAVGAWNQSTGIWTSKRQLL